MRFVRMRGTLLLGVVALAGFAAGCGEQADSPGKVEAQLEKQFGDHTRFVECDRSQATRYTCKLETSSDRYRYVATCPIPGAPCTIRRTGTEFK